MLVAFEKSCRFVGLRGKPGVLADMGWTEATNLVLQMLIFRRLSAVSAPAARDVDSEPLGQRNVCALGLKSLRGAFLGPFEV